jgi:uncharacterized protein (DUF305 family)
MIFFGTACHHAAGQTAADVRFMQGMLHHHAQALEMTALLPDRSSSRDLALLAQRIEISQRDEIAWMGDWLERQEEDVPDTGAHPGHDHQEGSGNAQEHVHDASEDRPLMPGMLTTEQMAELADATGDQFDRLFLRYMIQHHEGALTMVSELFSIEGAAQDPDVFRMASEIDSDQRAEIRRMSTMLDALPESESER